MRRGGRGEEGRRKGQELGGQDLRRTGGEETRQDMFYI